MMLSQSNGCPPACAQGYRQQTGFTLIEVLVAIVIVVLLSAVLYPSLTSAVTFSQKTKTQGRLNEIRKALVQAYTDNAMVLDDNPGATALLSPSGQSGTATALKTGVSIAPGQTTGAQTGMATLASYVGGTAATLAVDGFHHPWAVYVSNRLSKKWHGYTVYYHVIAFVSNNGGRMLKTGPVLAAGTSFSPTTGKLTLAGGDVGIAVSGLPIEVAKYKQTLETEAAIATQYENFFSSRYLGSAARDISVDFFSRACSGTGTNSNLYDAASPIANSCLQGGGYVYPGSAAPDFSPQSSASCTDSARVNNENAGFASTLGLARGSTLSAWGQPLGYGNGPDAQCNSAGVQSRNPSSSVPAMQTPPYTALIEAWAPGGVPLTVTASGTY